MTSSSRRVCIGYLVLAKAARAGGDHTTPSQPPLAATPMAGNSGAPLEHLASVTACKPWVWEQSRLRVLEPTFFRKWGRAAEVAAGSGGGGLGAPTHPLAHRGAWRRRAGRGSSAPPLLGGGGGMGLTRTTTATKPCQLPGAGPGAAAAGAGARGASGLVRPRASRASKKWAAAKWGACSDPALAGVSLVWSPPTRPTTNLHQQAKELQASRRPVPNRGRPVNFHFHRGLTPPTEQVGAHAESGGGALSIMIPLRLRACTSGA
jgi:hypothetical protein